MIPVPSDKAPEESESFLTPWPIGLCPRSPQESPCSGANQEGPALHQGRPGGPGGGAELSHEKRCPPACFQDTPGCSSTRPSSSHKPWCWADRSKDRSLLTTEGCSPQGSCLHTGRAPSQPQAAPGPVLLRISPRPLHGWVRRGTGEHCKGEVVAAIRKRQRLPLGKGSSWARPALGPLTCLETCCVCSWSGCSPGLLGPAPPGACWREGGHPALRSS